MKKTIILITIIFLNNFCFSQNSVFDNYNLGNFQLQGIYLQQHHFPNVADTISNFYMNDSISLQWCKSNWKVVKPVDRYIDSYTYRIDIIRNKQSEGSIWINLNDDVIRTDEGVFEFENHLLLDLRENLLPLGFSEYKFSSIEEGRNSLNNIVSNDSVVSYFNYWNVYDGTFSVKIPYTKDQISTEDVKLRVEKELLNQFTNETFELTYITSLDFSDYSSRVFEIKCSNKLFLDYKKDKSEWKPYEPILYLRIKN